MDTPSSHSPTPALSPPSLSTTASMTNGSSPLPKTSSPTASPGLASSPTAAALASANAGFDVLFANQIAPARSAFHSDDTPFHLLGLGVCAFLEGMLLENGAKSSAKALSMSYHQS
ncbi:hypothetical protein FB451DRAFT_1241631 [Mycena latifolia]|nr:hypothetical protein FB451DRAFT_1241631 [Mycena latifolia]